MVLKEACVGSFEASKKAVLCGADRLELCENLLEGGTTPSYGTIAAVQKHLDVPVQVMIRPRGGNFVYTSEEVDIMKSDIEICKRLGVYGVVFGVLTEEGALDYETLKELVSCSKPMQVTFHMAFDVLSNPDEALEALIDLGFDRVLTKGCQTNALEGVHVLRSLVNRAKGRIKILAGGGVTHENFMALVKQTGVSEVHGTKIVSI